MAAKKRATAKGTSSTRGATTPARAKRPSKRVARPSAVRASSGVAASASVKAARAAPAAKKAAKKQVASRKPAAAARGAGSAAGSDVSAGIREGDRAPEFALEDARGQRVSSRNLAGQPYVLYFYPKDDTPGCTTEACGFRDAEAEFGRVGVRVLGVSPDSVASHQRFADKYGLSFTLLSDPERELASKYGTWALKKNYGREYMGIVRSTFLIDGGGVVRKAWRGVRVNGHVAEVRAAAAELQ